MSRDTSRNASRLRASHSRPRNSSVSSVPYVPQPESLIAPGGAVGGEAAELLQDFVHPHRHDAEETLIDEEGEEPGLSEEDELFAVRAKLPWWRRPSPWWLIAAIPFSAIAMAATMAPRIEIYTILACSVHRPEYTRNHHLAKELNLPYLGNNEFFTPGPTLGVLAGHENIQQSINISFSQGQIHQSSTEDEQDCASDPVVQAAVAKLTAVISTSAGVLTCITTVWWSALSDRYGRTIIMGISILGLLITDFNFIFVTKFSTKLPGGYWFLVVGPVLEGVLGGMSTGIAGIHAYIADTTRSSDRSPKFSLMLGLLFTGVALGPTLGGLLMRATGSVLSVFYAATLLHMLYAILIWVMVPESLTKDQMLASRTRHNQEIQKLKEAREGIAVGILVRIRRLFNFLSPLTLFVPKAVEGQNPSNWFKRDWSLLCTGLAYGFLVSLLGSYPYKFQYLQGTFHWTSEINGYFITIAGAARAFVLTVILPIGIKLFTTKAPAVQLPADGAPSQTSKPGHSPTFDLNLARVSLLVEIVAYIMMGFAKHPAAFIVATFIGSLASGFSPAIHSVAVEVFQRGGGGRETGKLFGAMSVIQALCTSVIGPSMFGFVYIKTVKAFPAFIFFLCSILVLVSFLLTAFIRIPKESAKYVVDTDAEEQTPLVRDETLVNLEPEADEPPANKATRADSLVVEV